MPRRAHQTFAHLLTVRQAAVYLGVSPNTLRAWDHAGKLPAKRHPINGYRLYDRGELDALLRHVRASNRNGGGG